MVRLLIAATDTVPGVLDTTIVKAVDAISPPAAVAITVIGPYVGPCSKSWHAGVQAMRPETALIVDPLGRPVAV